MPEHLEWFVGNRDPSIAETMSDEDGVPISLDGKSVRFKAREVGSAVLLIDEAATIVTPPGTNGQVRYDWTAADITAPAGALSSEHTLLVWWEVTTVLGGRTQDYAEAVIHVQAHAPDQNSYVEVGELKKTLELDRNFADLDIQSCLVAASRAVNDRCRRRFYLDTDDDQVRYYSAVRMLPVDTDDIVAVTELATDPGGDGTFEDVWTAADYTLEPLNAAADGRPYERIRAHPTAGPQAWPYGFARTIRVTGQFGWPVVPEGIKTATRITATRLLRQVREAPFGVVAVGLEGQSVQISRSDPGVAVALAPYMRDEILA